MEKDLYIEKVSHLTFSRNVFAALSVLLGSSLCVTSGFLFLKQERIVVTPPSIEKPFWVETNRVSPSYLEQFGSFIGQLILGKSEYSAAKQREILLRHTSPYYAPRLNQMLIEEEVKLKKENCSCVFFPTQIDVNPETMVVKLTGDKIVYVGDKQILNKKEAYTLNFVYLGGQILLDEVTTSAS